MLETTLSTGRMEAVMKVSREEISVLLEYHDRRSHYPEHSPIEVSQ
jgi:hypothetical protein